MKKYIKLPVHLNDVTTVTECWTFNRLAIIKNSPYYKDWIAAHYNLYADVRQCNFLFGNISKYEPAYYEEILNRQQIHLFQLNKNNVVVSLKKILIEDFYIIAYVKTHKNNANFHEVLIYGYDDLRQCFLTIGLKDRVFQEATIDYSHIEETIEDIKEYFLQETNRSMKLSVNYQYPFTALKLKTDFYPHNCAFEAFKKLIFELNGKEFVQESLYDIDVCEDRKHALIITGIKCLEVFNQILEKEINDEPFSPWFRGVASAAKKLLEHRLMIKCSMEYVLEKWNISMTDNARVSCENYSSHIFLLEKWVNLCLKYELTKDKSLLEKVSEEIPKVFELERQCLNDFVNNGIDWELFNKNYI